MPSGKFYGRAMSNLAKGAWGWTGSDVVKAAFVRSTYTFNQDTHEFWSDVSTNEAWSSGGAGDALVGSGGAGLAQGGTALAGKAVTYDAASNTSRLDADDIVLPGVTHSSVYGIVLYGVGAGASSSPLIAYFNISDVGQTSYSNTTLTVEWNSLGVLQLPVAE